MCGCRARRRGHGDCRATGRDQGRHRRGSAAGRDGPGGGSAHERPAHRLGAGHRQEPVGRDLHRARRDETRRGRGAATCSDHAGGRDDASRRLRLTTHHAQRDPAGDA